MRIEGNTFAWVWHSLTERLLASPAVSPRGLKVFEQIGVQLYVNQMSYNILSNPVRNLNYRFMVAEWLWIWFGHNDVKTIAQYNKNITKFSDDGVKFEGAYGPPFLTQLRPTIDKLLSDNDSRQAVIDIYGRTPAGTVLATSKDVPCTISLQFLIRQRRLHLIANMRSSDVWLGLPYDFFNFTMFANGIASQLGVPLGSATFNLGSSHLYDTNREAAHNALDVQSVALRSPQLPTVPPLLLDVALQKPDDGPPASLVTPWYDYAEVLHLSPEAAKQTISDLSIKATLI